MISELHALGLWLETHANPATRLAVLDPSSRSAVAGLSAGELATMRAIPRACRHRQLAMRIASALRRGRGRRLLVLFDHRPMAAPPATAVLALRAVPGAQLPDPVDVSPNHTLRLEIDSRRPHVLAATIARAVIKLTGMTERR